jgi:hypothetical protein
MIEILKKSEKVGPDLITELRTRSQVKKSTNRSDHSVHKVDQVVYQLSKLSCRSYILDIR